MEIRILRASDVRRFRGMLGNMPGYLADPECFGVKLVSLIPRNQPPLHSSHLGIVLLFEPEHGRPVALLDGAEITVIRTAAASALATRWLARPGAGDLALLGAGEQAQSHLQAMLCVRPLRRVRVWARDQEKARSFARTETVRHGIEIEVSGSVQEAVEGADIVCTLTKAREPILEGARPGHSHERGGLQRAGGCRDRHAGRGACTILRRLPEFDRSRRRRVLEGIEGGRQAIRDSIIQPADPVCGTIMMIVAVDPASRAAVDTLSNQHASMEKTRATT
jgi:hypothetical protein